MSRLPNPHPPADRLLLLRPSLWLAPFSLLAFACMLTVLPAALAYPSLIQQWREHWILTSHDYYLILVGFAIIAAGMAAGGALARSQRPAALLLRAEDVSTLDRLASILFWVFLGAYSIWIASAVSHGFGLHMLTNLVSGEAGASTLSRSDFATIPGVTTFTQVGPFLAGLLTLLGRLGVRRPATFTVTVALSAFRVLANSERLGLIEVFLPIVVVLLFTQRHTAQGSRRSKLLRKSLPLLVPLGVYLLFTIAEQGRSWNSYYSTRSSDSLWLFSLKRIWAYYATATNNSAVYAVGFTRAHSHPWLSINWFWSAPILPSFAEKHFGLTLNFDTPSWFSLLDRVASPEFNNPGTILPIFAEDGLWIGGVLLFVMGAAFAALYQRMRAGSLVALLAYASVVIGVVEIPRYPYYFGGRFLPVVLAIAFAAYLVRKRTCPKLVTSEELQLNPEGWQQQVVAEGAVTPGCPAV